VLTRQPSMLLCIESSRADLAGKEKLGERVDLCFLDIEAVPFKLDLSLTNLLFLEATLSLCFVP